MFKSHLRPQYLVSACLCGRPCRYDGTSRIIPGLLKLHQQGLAVLACPECLGGLKIPRAPAEIQGDRIFDANGLDLSGRFYLGAQRTLNIALKRGITKAILKERSPSCASRQVYDGTFSRSLIPGQGITTALLRQHGIEVISEEDID